MAKSKKMLGMSVRDITPKGRVPLAGFAHRLEPTEKIASSLYLKCFSLIDGKKTVILVVGDLIWWGDHLVEEIKKQVQKQWGISESSVLLHSTHTHCGPQTSLEVSEELGGVSLDYLDFLRSSVLQGIEDALADQEEIVADGFSYGILAGSIHRRRKVDGRIKMLPNEKVEIDKRLQMCGFYRKKDLSLKALWVFGECHPTVADLDAISSEYPGALTSQLEKKMPSVTAVFFQGACGDIRPAMIQNNEFYKGTFADIQKMGKEIADEILEGLADHIPHYQELYLSSYLTKIKLSMQDGNEKELVVQKQQIFNGFDLLAVNAEIVQNYRLRLVEDLGDERQIWLLGYSNGMIGYLGTADQIREGGYEGKDFCRYFNLTAPFVPEIENQVTQELTNILTREESNERE